MSLITTLCLLTIFIVLSLSIGTVNLEDKHFQLFSAQANISTNYNTTDSNNIQNNISLITNILAKNLENRIQKAGAILEITSKLPQVRDVPYAHLLNQTLNTLY
ncbi:MAG: hypothetical protein QN649_10610, partial [Nitrososphaeraceae archaeon]|nr:hypothetical protein [Nitrososphaeraceae archaeon]